MLTRTVKIAAILLVFVIAGNVFAQDSLNVSALGHYSPGAISSMVIKDDLAYLASNDLIILDISDSENPEEIKRINTDYWIHQLIMVSDTLYALDYMGIKIYDIADALNPVLISFFDTPHGAKSMAMHGSVMFISDMYYEGLNDYAHILSVDISIYPPILLDSYPDYFYAYGDPGEMCIEDNYLYVADDYGSYILNVSNPSDLNLVFEFENHHYLCRVNNGLLFMSETYNLEIYDIVNPSNPELIWEAEEFDCNGITFEDTIAFVYNSLEGLEIWNMSDPTQPAIISLCEIDLYSYCFIGEVLKINDIIYLENWGGFHIIDVNDIYNPEIVSTLYQPSFPEVYQLSGNHVFTLANRHLFAIDFSDPTAPLTYNSMIIPSTYYWDETLKIDNGLAFYADSDSMYIIDISNPDSMFVISTIALDYVFNVLEFDIYCENDIVITVTNRNLLKSYYVADPYNPVELAEFDLPIDAFNFCFENGFFYVLDENENFRIIDFTMPTIPTMRGMIHDGNFYFDFCVYNDVCYLEYREEIDPNVHSIYILDVSDPDNPHNVGSVPSLPSGVTGLSAADDHLYVALGLQGLQIYDITTPESPVVAGYYNPDYSIVSLISNNSILYASAYGNNGGIYAYNISEALQIQSENEVKIPTFFHLHPIHPNPFNPTANIAFAVSDPGLVKLEVFDIQGRLVEVLKDEYLTQGDYSITWNAEKNPSGIYLVRLTQGDNSIVKKAVLVK